MEYNFKKVHTGKDLIISILLIVAGAGLFFLNKGLGITIGICGLVCLLIFKAGYKLNGKGVVLTKKSEDLCKCCRTSVIEFLNGKNTTPVIKRGNEGGIIRLDVYFNKTERVAYVQAFDFCNYTYEAATEVVELEGNRAEMIYSKL